MALQPLLRGALCEGLGRYREGLMALLRGWLRHVRQRVLDYLFELVADVAEGRLVRRIYLQAPHSFVSATR